LDKIERTSVLAFTEMGYGEGCQAIDAMHKREMAIRTKDLREADKAMAREIARITGGQIVDFALDTASDWTIMMNPLRDLKIYFMLQRYSPEFEDELLTFFGKETRNIEIPIDDLYDFTRLCANAMVRAARQLSQH